MKIIKSLDDIIYYTAKECNVSEDVVRNVHKMLWWGIRRKLRYPHRVGLGIHLPSFMRITLRETKIWTEWQKAKKYKDVKPTYKTRFYRYKDVNYYETLYNEIKRLTHRWKKNRRLNPEKWTEHNKKMEEKYGNKNIN